MFPILFHIGNTPIQSYGAFIALGYLAAILLVKWISMKRGLDSNTFVDLCFLSLLVGIIGARALFVLTNLTYFRANPVEAIEFWGGGLVFYGGLLLVAPTLILVLNRRKIPWKIGFDILAPALALGHAIGRIGCFAAGCCHGSYCDLPWAVHLNSPLVDPSLRNQPIHPVQLYESVSLFVLAGFLTWLALKRPRAGTVASAYVAIYGFIRFVLEFFRGDSIRGELGGLSTSQWISAPLILAALILFASGIRSVRR